MGIIKKAVKKFRLTRPEPTEAQVLYAVMARLKYHPNVAWVQRMNSGAHVVGEGRARRFIKYGFTGMPDIVAGLKDGRTAWIEVKSRTGAIRPDQQAFIDLCVRHGIPAGVARSMQDAVAIVEGQ